MNQITVKYQQPDIDTELVLLGFDMTPLFEHNYSFSYFDISDGKISFYKRPWWPEKHYLKCVDYIFDVIPF